MASFARINVSTYELYQQSEGVLPECVSFGHALFKVKNAFFDVIQCTGSRTRLQKAKPKNPTVFAKLCSHTNKDSKHRDTRTFNTRDIKSRIGDTFLVALFLILFFFSFLSFSLHSFPRRPSSNWSLLVYCQRCRRYLATVSASTKRRKQQAEKRAD